MKRLLLATILTLGSQAFAADAFRVKNLGFSADGRYYAFIEHLIQDGSGFAQAVGQVIDVARNQTVEYANVILEKENSSEREAIDQAGTRLRLNHYGITGANPGQTLWMRFPTDLSAPVKKADFSLDYGVDDGASSVQPKFKLTVTERPAPEDKECYNDVKLISVDLLNRQTNVATNLQNDTRLPKSRACANAYQVRQVLKYGSSIAVIVRYESQGFEGPDYTHIAVTGSEVLK